MNNSKATKSVVIKNNKIVSITAEAKLEMLDKMRDNLPKYIKKRKKEFIKQLEELELAKLETDDVIQIKDNRLDITEFTENCFEPFIKVPGIRPTYSPEQISIVYDYYRYCTKEINKQFLYIPNKEDLCRMLSISTSAFNEYGSSSASLEMREIIAQINDWISAWITQHAIQEKVEKNYSIFYQKAALGRRDNDPIQVNNYTQNNTILPDAEFRELLSKYSSDIQKPQN